MSLYSHTTAWKISDRPIYKLTLLWAFAESGLGGLLHGFKIPITGFVLGAFSIVLITLIAHFSKNVFEDLIQATLFVVAVKFAVSPHSPLPAYVAVCFQGFLGAILFKICRPSLVVIIFFSMIVMIESAIQKPIVATLLFGKELWLGFDEMVKQLLHYFSIKIETSLLYWILAFYIILYTVWGIIVGVWSYRLPKRLLALNITFNNIEEIKKAKTEIKKKSKLKFWNILIGVMLMLSVLFIIFKIESAWIYIIRTAAIIIVVYFVIVPISKKLLSRFSSASQEKINDYYEQLPNLKWQVEIARKLSLEKSKGLKSYFHFIEILIWLSLMPDDTEK